MQEIQSSSNIGLSFEPQSFNHEESTARVGEGRLTLEHIERELVEWNANTVQSHHLHASICLQYTSRSKLNRHSLLYVVETLDAGSQNRTTVLE